MASDPGIGRKNLIYGILKKYIDLGFRHYYKVSYTGKDKAITKGKIIYAPNHQNALIDALAVLTTFTWQPVFLARSDIFANKTIARILTFLKMLPVYRIRDGFDQVSNNREVFEKVFAVMENDIPITIMPEGNHDDRKLLRPMKKGIARLAFSFRHYSSSADKEVFIIPVGLHYFDHHTPRSPLHIRFGDPIPVSGFDSEYAENPPRAANSFLKELHTILSSMMLHVGDQDIYPLCDDVTTVSAALAIARGDDPEVSFKAQQKIVEKIGDIKENDLKALTEVTGAVAEVKNTLQTKNLTLKDLQYIATARNTSLKRVLKIAALTITSPFYLYALINNFLPSSILRFFRKKIKDPQFVSSVAFVCYYLIYPLIHLVQTLIIGLIAGSGILALGYLVTLPVSFGLQIWWEKTRKYIIGSGRLSSIEGAIKEKISQISVILNEIFL